MTSVAPPLSTNRVVVEGHQTLQARFVLSEAMLAVAFHLLIFHVPERSFQEHLLHDVVYLFIYAVHTIRESLPV